MIHFVRSRNLAFSAFILMLVLMFAARGESLARNPSGKSPGMALGATLSTGGPGLSFSVETVRNLSLRLGYERLSFTLPFSFEESGIAYDADLGYRAGNLSFMADYQILRFLYLTGGVGYNLFHPVVTGEAAGDWIYGDITVPASEIGEFRFEILPSYSLSPYAGLGLGRKISRKGRLAFSGEAGIFYQGPPRISIEATGLLAPTADGSHKQAERIENQISAWKYYPVVRFSLSYLLVK